MELGGRQDSGISLQPVDDAGGAEVRPAICYSLVAAGPEVVLCEYTSLNGNFQQVARSVLKKLDPAQRVRSYVYDDQAFHYVVDDSRDLWFVCMASSQLGRRLPFSFLAALQESFVSRGYAPDSEGWLSQREHIQADFAAEIRGLMERHNKPDADRVTRLSMKTEQIHEHLMVSIDKLMERGEKIDLLVQQTEGLSEGSTSFHRTAVALRRTYWWQSIKTKIVLVLAALLLIFIIVWAGSGIKFDGTSFD
mmetsp:Transcript_41704/g.73253  ORF Transcript_41704/g.73253 Transcript_41704/m.73253 type:complete len:250 (+) Transcript_41704:47-796(+)